ncbi:MAG: HD domain-containing phosphohydrolase [Chloroflexota bacterium]
MSDPHPVRLVDLLAPLSLVTDLGMGQPAEDAMRACFLGTGLARRMGLSEEDASHVFYTTLLRHVGCTASAHEEAAHIGGDELATRPLAFRTDFNSPREALRLMVGILRLVPPARRPRVLLGSFGPWGDLALHATCEVGAEMARRLGMHDAVALGLYQSFERWDGKGVPRKLAGEDIALPARFAQVATLAVALDQVAGTEAAVAVIRARSGGMLDPAVAAAFAQHGPALLAEVTAIDVLPAILATEPEPHRRVSQGGVDGVARAFADMIDLKSRFTHGHSAAVAQLAAGAGRTLGLGEVEVTALRRAGWLHDLGRLSVPDGIWEKRGRLTPVEWERVRLHPYHTERILARSDALAPLAALAGMHHERQDGSGYYRQASGAAIPMSARILAVADAYQAMTQERAHRPALSADAAAAEVDAACLRGGLDREAAGAVLEVGGQRLRSRRAAPSGLSEREVEVLRLVAQGLSNRDIASRLFISPRTAESHVQHIYTKIGLSTRAGAAMFAMRHDLIA